MDYEFDKTSRKRTREELTFSENSSSNCDSRKLETYHETKMAKKKQNKRVLSDQETAS